LRYAESDQALSDATSRELVSRQPHRSSGPFIAGLAFVGVPYSYLQNAKGLALPTCRLLCRCLREQPLQMQTVRHQARQVGGTVHRTHVSFEASQSLQVSSCQICPSLTVTRSTYVT
jgi:hypothetical protein